jgi:hypothetical protein
MAPKVDKTKAKTATEDVQDNDSKEETKKVLNKETTKVGLNFNVKKFKDFMKTHYNHVHDNDSIKIMNAHYMLTTVNEVTLFNILTSVSHLFSKEKTGLQDLTLERLQTHIVMTDYLRESFSRFLTKYDSQLDYSKQLYVERTKFDNYIMTHCLHSNNTIHINKDTRNYLCFLLVQLNSHLASAAYSIAHHSKKKAVSLISAVNAQHLRASVDIYLVGKLREDVNKKLDEVSTILKNKPKQDSDKDSGEKKDKKDKKVKKTDDEDDEEDDDDDEEDEDDDEDDDEEDDEEEEEEEIKPKAKTTTSKGGKGKTSSK